MQNRPLCRVTAAYAAGLLFVCLRTWRKLIPALLLLVLLFWQAWRQRGQVRRACVNLAATAAFALLGCVVMQLARTPAYELNGMQTNERLTVTGQIDDYEIKNDQIYYYIRLKNGYHRALVAVADNRVNDSSALLQEFTKEKQTENTMPAAIGMRVEAEGILFMYDEPTNTGQFDLRLYYKSRNVDFALKKAALKVLDPHTYPVRDALRRLQLSLSGVLYGLADNEEEAGVLSALLFGEKSGLGDEVQSLYQRNGIAHVLAISGLHVSLIGMALYRFLRRLCVPAAPAAAIGSALVIGFGFLSGMSVSALRAVVMYAVLMGANASGRTYDLPSALSLAALIVLIARPYALFQASMQLSFCAVGALVLFPKGIKELCGGGRKGRLRRACQNTADSFLLSLKVQLTTAPALAYHYYYLSVYSVFLNLLVLPLVSVLFVCGISAVLMGSLFSGALTGAARLALLPCHWILSLYRGLCSFAEMLPHAVYVTGQPDAARLLVYGCLLASAALCMAKCKGRAQLLVCVPVLCMCLALQPAKTQGLQMTMLDVGQGDSVVLTLPDGTAVLSDGGSSDVGDVGVYRIRPYLLSQGVDTLSLVLVSHWDADHISGIEELLAENGELLKIETIVLPDAAKKDERFESFVSEAERAGAAVRLIGAGQSIGCGEARFDCLSPANGQTASDTNGYSAVYRVSCGDGRILLTGDLPTEDEETLLSFGGSTADKKNAEENGALHAQVLKIAHHGSKNATSETLLSYVQPQIALISCGEGNSYGHPHAELLRRLNDAGCRIFVTAETGEITLTFDANAGISVSCGADSPFADAFCLY